MNEEERFQEARQYWEDAASSFDEEPDHGLQDPLILETWTNFLKASFPSENATVLDIGCGTGSLSLVLARLGHMVTGIDLSPAMISLARTKADALGYQIEFHVMNAASPQFPNKSFDLIVCRHLLWTVPKPEQVLQKWAELLKQNGRLILIEGYWGTGAGLHAGQILKILPGSFKEVSLQNLGDNPDFWGRKVNDERYAIVVDKTE